MFDTRNPLEAPAHILPEWYLSPFYAILRAVPFDVFGTNTKIIALAIAGLAAVLLLCLPLLLIWKPDRFLKSWRGTLSLIAFILTVVALSISGISLPDETVLPSERYLAFTVDDSTLLEASDIEQAIMSYTPDVKVGKNKTSYIFKDYTDALEFAEVTGLSGLPHTYQTGLTWLQVSQIATISYFIYFCLILPILYFTARVHRT